MSTVLIVDDQHQTRQLLDRIVRYFGCRAVQAQTGPEALDYLRQELPDAVLLDFMMPDMDGLEVLRTLRNDPRTKGLPVIIFSAIGDARTIASAMNAGASDYWVKASVGISEMHSRLSRWLPPMQPQAAPAHPASSSGSQ